jgi:hypothetical protein
MISKGVFTRSKVKQTFAHVGDSPKKPTTWDTIKPLGSQRGDLKANNFK